MMDKPIARWKLDELAGTTAFDDSGNGHDGTFHGANDGTLVGPNDGAIHGATWVDGKYGKALSFDGINDYLRIEDALSLNPTSQFTWMFWLKVHTYTAVSNCLIEKSEGTAPETRIQVANTGIIQLSDLSVDDENRSLDTITPIELDHWVHYTLTYDGVHIRVYLDGEKDNELAVTGVLAWNDEAFLLGKWRTDVNFLNGLLDEIHMYNRALTQAEITDAYENNVYPRDSNMTLELHCDEGTGVTAHDTSMWATGKFDGALNSDEDNYVNIPYHNIGGTLSYSLWFNPSDQATQRNLFSFMGTSIRVGASSITWFADVTSGQTAISCTLVNGQWYHLVITETGTTYAIYLDGELKVSGTTSAVNTGGAYGNSIGYYSAGVQWVGLIDDVRIFSKVLSQSEVTLLHTDGIAPRDGSMVGEWLLDETSGTVAYDTSRFATGKFDGALKFDGVDDYVGIDDPTSLTYPIVTLAMWIKTSKPNQVKYFFNHLKDDSNRIGLYLNGSHINTVDNLSGVPHVLTSTTTILSDTWYFIAYVVDSSSNGHKLYINGILEASANYGHAWNDIGIATSTSIGAYLGVQYVDAIIDEVHIYGRALLASEVCRLFTRNTTKFPFRNKNRFRVVR